MGGVRALGLVGGLVAVVVAVGLWLVLGDEGATDAPRDDGGTPAAGDATPAPGVAEKAARRRARTSGTAVLTGVVKRRADGAPAPGETVALLHPDSEDRTAATDASGAFRFDALADGGPYEVVLASKGFATVRLPGIALGRGESRDVGTLWLDRAVRLPVAVRDWGGAPVAGAEVLAYAAPEFGDDFDWSKAFAQMAQDPVPVARHTTGADGRAVFPELASGTWHVVATAPGRTRGSRRGIVLRGGETPDEVVVRLGPGHALAGRVLDADRKPVPGATVLAGGRNDLWDVGAAAARVRARSGPDGRYVLDGLDAGDAALWVGRAGTVPQWLATVRVPAVREFDLVLRPTGAIEGTVTEREGGKPVPGALVRAASWGGSVATGEATTDDAGRYRIDPFPAGDVHSLDVEKAGLVQRRDDATRPASPARVHAGEVLRKDLVMERGASLAGTVTCGGAPVAGAKVLVRSARPDDGRTAGTATTGADGKWRIDALAPGPVFAQARKDGHHQPGFPEEWWTLVQDASSHPEFRAEVPETGEARLDLVLRRGVAVRGRVEGPDGPVAGAQVGASSGTPARSGADGTFVLEGVVPGPEVRFHASKTGLVPAGESKAAVLEDAGAEGVVVRLARAPVVRGRVTRADGSAPVAARVVVGVAPQAQGALAFLEEESGFDGREAVGVAPDGTYEATVGWTGEPFVVRAFEPGGASVDSAPVAQEAGRAEYSVDLRLPPPLSLRGRVVSGASGVPGAHVSLKKRREQTEGLQFVMAAIGGGDPIVAVTGADGSFEAPGVSEGSWDVTATAHGYVRAKREAVAVPATGGLVVEVEPELEIAGRVVFEDGSPAEGVQVQAVPEGAQGPRFDAVGPEEDERQSTTGSDGRFRLRGIAAGSYRLRAEAGWQSRANVRTTTSDPVAAGTTDAKVVVRPGGRIAGRVLDGSRKGVAGAWIQAMPSDAGDPHRWTETAADGAFELTSLGERPYTLLAQSRGGGFRPGRRVGVAPGTTDVELVLEAGLSIEGVLVRADGTPVPNVQLRAERRRAADEGDAEPMAFEIGADGGSTDSEGRFRLAGLAPGRYDLKTAQWFLGGGSANEVQVRGGDDVPAGTTGLRLVATEGATVAGVVLDEAGAAIAGAAVTVDGDDLHRAVQTGADGRFAFAGLPEGKVRLAVQASGRASASLRDVPAGATDLRIVLRKGLAVSGRILAADGKPAPRLQIWARSESDPALSAAGRTDDSGRFALDGLSEGTWIVSTLREIGNGAFTWLEVGKVRAGTADAELRVPQ